MTVRETLLLTGATGHLGAAIARQLLAHPDGPRLRLLIRDEGKLRALAASDPGLASLMACERIVGDIRDAAKVEAALSGVDGVIHACHSHEYWRGSKHLLDVNLGGARNLVRALATKERARKVVYVGSYSAHGVRTNGHELEAAQRASARECSSRSKKLAQEVFLAAAAEGRFRLDIVSPSYMIGPLQIDPTYFGALFHLVLLKPLRWCPPNGINLIDVRDVARSVLDCVTGDHEEGRQVLASGDNLPLQDLFAEMNRQAGFARAPRKLPGKLFGLMPSLKQFGRFGRHYFRSDHYVDGAGLAPRLYTLEESVRDSLSWARDRPLYKHRGEFLLWLADRYLF
jgi:dihydroflavonol-4-reductase